MPKASFLKCWGALVILAVLAAGCPKETIVTPIPQFTYSPSTGLAPLKVRFRDMSIPGKTRIQAWHWNFGDGGTAVTPDPEYVYKEPGTYDVTLMITTAEGAFTKEVKGAIRVDQPGIFGKPDENNTFSADGISITLPSGFSEEVVFGVFRNNEQLLLSTNYDDKFIPLSDTYSIMHNLENPDFFLTDLYGQVIPATISIKLYDRIPSEAGALNLPQLLVRFEDWRTVPVPGTISGHTFKASVARLPKRAQYIVVQREDLNLLNLPTTNTAYQERIAGSWRDHWGDTFSIFSFPRIRQILTALYQGSMDNEASFHRRNFSDYVVGQTMLLFADYVQQTLNDLAAAGLQPPLLICENRNYNLNLFSMHPAYSHDIEIVAETAYYDAFFGHLVLDPAQLMAVTIRNFRAFEANSEAVDYKERFAPEAAFGEALMQCVFPAYGIPDIVTQGNPVYGLPVPADRTDNNNVKAISFVEGLRDGGALYTGRRYQLYKGRGFGANEYGLLSEPLLFPYNQYIRKYSFSGHEFFAWLDQNRLVADPLIILAHTFDLINEELDLLDQLQTKPLNFSQGLEALYKALNKAFQMDSTGAYDSLTEYYWNFLKDYAYINGRNAVLRPSDSLREPYTFNQDRLDANAIITLNVVGAENIVVLSPSTDNRLKNVNPMACRAIVLNLHPTTSEVSITMDTSGFALENVYVPHVAVYQEGQEGVTFSDIPGNIRNYSLVDTTGDGYTDTIQITDLGCFTTECSNRVIILAANLQFNAFCDLEFEITTSYNAPVSETNVLRRYVTTYDPLYEYSFVQTINNTVSDGYAIYLLSMTSGAWRGAHEVYDTIWTHDVAIIEPNDVNKTTAMLFITGGEKDLKSLDAEQMRTLDELAKLAKSTRSIVAALTLVPNQPLVFSGERSSRSEDAIIAYSFKKYFESFDAGTTDLSWPVLLPMTRAAVRAMDTIQDFIANKPGRLRTVENFVVSGASKRGWTTWLTAAVDDRVSAIIPIVSDVLNMPNQIEHHRRAYASYPPNDPSNYIFNGYSTALRDYVSLNIFDRFGDAAGESLMRIVDPYRYRSVLTMPKLIANATGDQFFLPDATQFYYNDLPGINYLHYAPNRDHSLTSGLTIDQDSLNSIKAFYAAQVNNIVIPSYTYHYDIMSTEITVLPSVEPLEVLFWVAYAPSHRDFRSQTLGNVWQSSELTPEIDGVYRATIGSPLTGWRAGFIQLRFAGPIQDVPFVFSTPVWITPDFYPAR